MSSVSSSFSTTETPPRFSAVIMAGTRGSYDPVAAAHGTTHKCLVNANGKAMVERVIDNLASSNNVARIALCVEPSMELTSSLAALIAAKDISIINAATSPAASALAALEYFASERPLLILTADHPLLNAQMIDYFCANLDRDRDVSVALAHATQVLDAYPQSVRTLLRFADGPYCGCNLFALHSESSRKVVEFWVTLEANRKRPWRLIRALGPVMLLRYLFGTLTLRRAIGELSRRLNVDIEPVDMPFAEAAIDVDRSEDLELIEQILRKQANTDPVN